MKTSTNRLHPTSMKSVSHSSASVSRRSISPVLALALALAAAAPSVRAQVPLAISYQGRVADNTGAALGTGTPVNRKIIFRIWNHPTNNAGPDRLWTEEQTVTIFNGDFSVILGQGVDFPGESRLALDSVFGGADRFMEITVDDGDNIINAADQPIAPRQQITSTAFAMRAATANAVNATGQAAINATGQADANPSRFNWMNARNLTVDGHSKITGGNALEFGINSNKGADSGYINYDTNAQVLNVVGGRSQGGNRQVTLFAEGGTNFTGPINFGNRLGQHINLWGNSYGLGIEAGTLFSRSDNVFRWIRGGAGASGGTEAARLDGNGFTLSTGTFNGNLNGNFSGTVFGNVNGNVTGTLNGNVNGNVNGAIDRNGHGVFAQSFGGGHSVGSQDWTTFFRTGRHFAWYKDGSFNQGELNAGGGSMLGVMNSDGLYVGGNIIKVGTNRTGEEGAAGTIGYKVFSDALDIVGAGSAVNTRKAKIWAEGGTYFNGPIEANGWFSRDSGGYTYYARRAEVPVYTGFASGTVDVSIKASNRVVATEFNATSDSRIKRIIGQSDTSKDLATLLKVKVTDYTKIDDMAKTPRAHKKVIAQDVEAIFPQAVSQMPGTVPDIFATFTAKAGFIALKQPLKGGLKVGEVLKAFPEKAEPGKAEVMLEVTEVQKDGFRVKDKLDGNLFIYGRKVEDLRTVDYEAIAMLNVSATQELHRTIQKQTVELNQLREEKVAVQQQLTASLDANKLQDARLAAIEKQLSTGTGKSAVGTKLTGSRPQ